LLVFAAFLGAAVLHAQGTGAAASGGGQGGPGQAGAAATSPIFMPEEGIPLQAPTPPPIIQAPATSDQLSDEGVTPAERRARAAQTERVTVNTPPPPTEFQLMVANTTGHLLPIYGASLFNHTPSTFAPVDEIPVTPDYVIGPDDEIVLQVWGQVNFSGRYTVNRSGSIYLPQLGTLHVAGLNYGQLLAYMKSELGRVFRNFDLTVNLGQLRSIQIFVTGQAVRPGSYTVSSLSTLVNALFATGGPSAQGSLRDIQLKRGDSVVTHFDLYDLLLRGDKSKDVMLLPGDVIYIPSVGTQVAVVGSITVPAIYELHNENTVADLISLAGGLSNVAALGLSRLERIYDHKMRSVLDVPLTPDGEKMVLQNGDILEIVPVVDKFTNAVTLRGNVAIAGHYVWHEGMRLRDLIPDKDALVTRDYWRRRNALGYATPDYTAARVGGGEGALNIAGSVASATGGTTQDSIQSPTAVAGETHSRFGPRNDVTVTAPDVDWSYAVIERQNPVDLSERLIAFNLGHLVLDGDESQNLELRPGDVVTIFSKADVRVPYKQQTVYVRLEGEFSSAGVYSVLPGETLRQLVARAGGLTSDAYLYGSEFLRESTRTLQQERMNEYADELEAAVNRQASSTTNRAVTQIDADLVQAQLVEARTMVSRLRNARAAGRIVLESKPDSSGIDALPDISLEDGDIFVVPHAPSIVNVIGSVYNAGSFLYDPRRRAGDYLRMAGGNNRDADAHRMFVIRADGSVVSRQYSNSITGGSFAALRMYPGDSVVVPESIDKHNTMRNLMDFSQIVSQFGLGAAAIQVLK
jgi:protein involved in polysaccharide export with SLBB domain